MTSARLDKVIEAYLKRLRHEAAVLPADRREELLREIRDHAASAVTAGESPDAVVAHLGDPQAVVAEAQSESAMPSQFNGTDVGVMLLMVATLALSVIAWAAAAVMVTRSASWSLKQKVIGVIAWPWGLYFLNLMLIDRPGPFGGMGPLMWFYWTTAPFGVWAWTGAVYLYRTHPARIARQRAKIAEGSRLHRALGDSFTLRR